MRMPPSPDATRVRFLDSGHGFSGIPDEFCFAKDGEMFWVILQMVEPGPDASAHQRVIAVGDDKKIALGCCNQLVQCFANPLVGLGCDPNILKTRAMSGHPGL